MNSFIRNRAEYDVTNLSIKATLSGDNTIEKKFDALTFDDVKDSYKAIKHAINKSESDSGKKLASINVSFKGQLNGKQVDESFSDFQSLRSFLKDKGVLKPILECGFGRMGLFPENPNQFDENKLIIKAVLSGDDTIKKKYYPITVDDAKDSYKAIKHAIDKSESDSGKKLASIKISIKGPFNGKLVDETFNDFNSFRSYLKKNFVLKPEGIGRPRPGMHT